MQAITKQISYKSRQHKIKPVLISCITKEVEVDGEREKYLSKSKAYSLLFIFISLLAIIIVFNYFASKWEMGFKVKSNFVVAVIVWIKHKKCRKTPPSNDTPASLKTFVNKSNAK